jgi:parallel beta-helix repeat protein
MSTSTTADLYVSIVGSNDWSGTLPEPNAEGTDGPLSTLEGARETLQLRKEAGELSGQATVLLRGGRYPIKKTIRFTPADSWPTTYRAYPGEQPILDGGVKIEGWHAETRNGVAMWVTEVPDVAGGRWYFHQLFVNGRRRRRPRLPKEGRFTVKGVPATHSFAPEYWGAEGNFYCNDGEIQNWENLTDVDVVAMHRWVEERLPISSFDPATNLVESSRYCIFALDPGDAADGQAPKFYVDNVKEALSEPGEWYLDRPTGELCYIPLAGETLASAEIFAPVIEQLIRLEGDPESRQYVEQLHFVGIVFEHTEWSLPPGGGERWVPHYQAELDYGSAPQGACHVPGAISFHGARYCSVEDCTIQNIGWYGIELTAGSQGNYIVGNSILDLGAGGLKAESRGYPNSDVPIERHTGANRITDNHIGDGGHVFHAALGIHCMECFGTVIAHNHIHDFFYSGVNCGWSWGYGVHIAKDNLIEKNHIHDIGHALLSDMGAIYMLGVQPGTVVRGNVVHDVEKSAYGGWGIYLDEGSSHMIVENNISYNCSSQAFVQHYGRENIVRNNIFALGREGQVRLGRGEDHNAFTFERNVVITNGQPCYTGGRRWMVEKKAISTDLNLFWDVSGTPLLCGSAPHGLPQNDYDMVGWQGLGYDIHSVIADPKCRDIANCDFTLEKDSPAWALGFKPIDASDVGPRAREDR